MDHASTARLASEEEFHVSHYAHNGLWRWEVLYDCLPADVCAKISIIKPPSAGYSDFPSWKLSNDGNFTLKTTYEILFNQEFEPVLLIPPVYLGLAVEGSK